MYVTRPSPGRKELLLLGVTETAAVLPLGPMLPKGNIVYKFVNNPANLPIMMQNLDNPIPRVRTLWQNMTY